MVPAARPAPAAGERELPAILLVFLALLLAGGMGLAGMRVFHARTPDGDHGRAAALWIPPEIARDAEARDAMIEAELQEIIAEEQARELERSPEPV